MKKLIVSIFFLVTLGSVNLVRAELIVEEVSTSYEISEQGFGELHVFNINFDITSIGEDTQIRQSTNKGFLPPGTPDYDSMGFVWEYDSSPGLTLTTYSDFSYTREHEVNRPEYFFIEDGNTRQLGIAVTFTVQPGQQGIVGINLIGGHTAEGVYFPIDISTNKRFVSSPIPEPASIALLLGLITAGSIWRRRG